DIEAEVKWVMLREEVNAGSIFVPFGGRTIRATSSWAGSTVKMSLRSPSGEIFDADTPGVRSGSTDVSEWLEIDDPVPGNWTVRVYGQDGPDGGEPTQASVYADVPPPAPPVVELSAQPVDGQADTFDLSASGPEGVVYTWAFSDGSTGEGVSL